MRLAVVSHACFRAVNRQVHVELCRRGVDVMIIAPASLRGDRPDPKRDVDPPIHFVPLTGENPRSYLFGGAEAVLTQFRPDVILVEADPVSRLAVSLGSWCRWHGVRLMCLSVDNLDFGFFPHLRRTGLPALPQATAKTVLHLAAQRLVSVVFTISADGTAIFRKRGYRKVVQVPLGFDPTLFQIDPDARAQVRAELGINADAIVFGYFGRIVPEKGVHLIVEALGHVARAHPGATSWRFMLDHFQPADYASKIDRLIEQSGLGPRVVRFEAGHNEIARYMCATDAVLLASLSTPASKEQYGRVIPEAMACGALAVVSDCGAPKYLVGECGVVLPEGNVERLTDALCNFIADPEKFAELRAAGARRATSQYSVPRQADIYLDELRVLTGVSS
jgi:glycosyltransferase involved in cell wall biosynthesis